MPKREKQLFYLLIYNSKIFLLTFDFAQNSKLFNSHSSLSRYVASSYSQKCLQPLTFQPFGNNGHDFACRLFYSPLACARKRLVAPRLDASLLFQQPLYIEHPRASWTLFRPFSRPSIPGP